MAYAKKWTVEDVSLLRQYWGVGKIEDLAARIGRTPANLRNKARREGLPLWTHVDGTERRKYMHQHHVTEVPRKYNYKARPEAEKETFRALIRLILAGAGREKSRSNLIDTSIDLIRKGADLYHGEEYYLIPTPTTFIRATVC